jgi:hypothetical protein
LIDYLNTIKGNAVIIKCLNGQEYGGNLSVVQAQLIFLTPATGAPDVAIVISTIVSIAPQT